MADWVGLIGGLAGLLALGVEAFSFWHKRRPRLQLFVPYNFTGELNGYSFLFVLVRISNASERPAHLYLETLTAQVRYEGQWYRASVPSFHPDAGMSFDLPEPIQIHAGVRRFPFFNKFDSIAINLDNPYTRYVAMEGPVRSVLAKADRLRLTFKDCNLVNHAIEADILRIDPATSVEQP